MNKKRKLSCCYHCQSELDYEEEWSCSDCNSLTCYECYLQKHNNVCKIIHFDPKYDSLNLLKIWKYPKIRFKCELCDIKYIEYFDQNFVNGIMICFQCRNNTHRNLFKCFTCGILTCRCHHRCQYRIDISSFHPRIAYAYSISTRKFMMTLYCLFKRFNIPRVLVLQVISKIKC